MICKSCGYGAHEDCDNLWTVDFEKMCIVRRELEMITYCDCQHQPNGSWNGTISGCTDSAGAGESFCEVGESTAQDCEEERFSH